MNRPRFTCVICQRDQPLQSHLSTHPSFENIPPLCHRCEFGLGKVHGYKTGGRSVPAIYHGPFRDRRMAYQIGALLECLEAEAHAAIWRADPANAKWLRR